jgi:aerobic C4-dicarboxylate transport protein
VSKKIFTSLTPQVLAAIVIGIVLGTVRPDFAVSLKPLGDIFINLVKMVVGPVVFLTVVTGIAGIGDMKRVGRVGVKAILYFEIVTTFALAIGLALANLVGPGRGLHVAVSGTVPAEIVKYTGASASHSTIDMLIKMVPDTVVGAFAKGELLPILVFSVLFGAALSGLGEAGKPLLDILNRLSKAFFGVIHIIVRVAPLGALGAMSFTIGRYGVHSLVELGALMATVYASMVLFIVVVLGIIAQLAGFPLWRFLAFIKEEILIVLGTSSSESALPQLMEKLERFGCQKSVVGLVIPTGYSFNLDGTSIYLSMAALFIAQAYDIPLSLTDQLSILAVLMLTSKGAAAVTGGGFITLAATLSATGRLPVEGLALLLGVDRFMSEARAITNLIGNSVATVVVAKWEKAFDTEQAVEEYRQHFGRPELASL